MLNEKVEVVVMFRKWKSANDPAYTQGEVFALFPELPATHTGHECVCYAHLGQHGGADIHRCYALSHPARPEEYAELASELESLGYILTVAHRITREMTYNRYAEVRRVASLTS